jgi:magnesium transporter
MTDLTERQTLAERLEDLMQQEALGTTALLDLLHQIHPADIAEVMDELTPESALLLFNLLAVDVAGEVLDETEREVTQLLFEQLPDEQMADILDELPMDDAARLLSDLEVEQAESLINLMSPEEAADVRSLLAYPEGTAGRLMNDHFIRLRSEWTVARALDFLRHVDPEVETVAYLYVADAGDRLTGVVPLRRLVVARPDKTIAEIYDTRVIAVSVLDAQEEVAEVVAKYDFIAVPVVDELGRLVGIVTVDDIMDVLEEEATEDIHRIGGSTPLTQPYFSVSVMRMARKRVGWLLILFLGGTLTTTVVGYFEQVLEQVLILSFFIPLLIGTAGNAGSQTVSTIIRALAVGEVEWRDSLRVLAREFATGLAVGTFLGVIGFFYTLLFWRTDTSIALVIGLTLPFICTWATMVAAMVPIAAEKLGIDPAVISTPFITTLVDATGLIIYFVIAQLILGL